MLPGFSPRRNGRQRSAAAPQAAKVRVEPISGKATKPARMAPKIAPTDPAAMTMPSDDPSRPGRASIASLASRGDGRVTAEDAGKKTKNTVTIMPHVPRAPEAWKAPSSVGDTAISTAVAISALRTLLIAMARGRSAMRPPRALPSEKPPRTVAMTAVQVRSEVPKNGARTRPAAISYVRPTADRTRIRRMVIEKRIVASWGDVARVQSVVQVDGSCASYTYLRGPVKFAWITVPL